MMIDIFQTRYVIQKQGPALLYFKEHAYPMTQVSVSLMGTGVFKNVELS